MSNWIEVPYVAHIVADIDDTDDVAAVAWSRRRAAAPHAVLDKLLAATRRALVKLRPGLAAAVFLLAFVAAACSDTSGPRPNEPVASVSVAPVARTLVPGEAVQLSAVARDAAGQELPGRSIAWSSSSEVVAAVAASGLVTGVAPGEAVISAAIEGVTATAAVRVATAGDAVDHVELEAAAPTIDEGEVQRFTATARDAAGNVIVGRGVQWFSSSPEVVTVAANGNVTGVRAGTAIIRARIDGKSAEVTVRVTTSLAFDLVFAAWEPFVGPEVFYQDFRDAQAPARRLFGPGRWAADPVPAPNGRKVAFVVSQPGGHSDLFVGSIDGEPFVPLTSGAAQDGQPAWSPDGRRIAFRRYTPGMPGAGSDVWVIDVETGNAINLTSDQHELGQGSPAWSPDGTRIAYTHTSGGTAHLWTMRPDGSEKRQVSTGDVYDDEPAWSPDGTTLTFTRSAPAIFGDIHLIDADGGNARKLMPFADLAFDQFAPAWSPDGRLIAFTSKHEGGAYQVYTVWADGSKLARRTSGGLHKENPAWVPREVIIWYQALTHD